MPFNMRRTTRTTAALLLNAENDCMPYVEERPIILTSEVIDIMHSFGDAVTPDPDSVKMVEHILYSELRGIFAEAAKISDTRRGKSCPAQADFEFLMRRHPVKIARMRKHLRDMRILKKFLNTRARRPEDYPEHPIVPENDEELDIYVPEMFDEERTRRLFRADRVTNLVTGCVYESYNEARKTSFYCRHGEKFKHKFYRFLELPEEIELTNTCINILAYLAHETVAVIVDHALLSRLNNSNRYTEPYSRISSAGVTGAMLHICPEVTQGRAAEIAQPITTREIQEGLRRYRAMTSKKVGFYRGYNESKFKNIFLAV